MCAASRSGDKASVNTSEEGASQGWAEHFQSMGPSLYRMILRIVGSPETAEEVLQETVAHVLARNPEATHIEQPEAYLRTAAKNRALNVQRQERTQARIRTEIRVVGQRRRTEAGWHAKRSAPGELLRFAQDAIGHRRPLAEGSRAPTSPKTPSEQCLEQEERAILNAILAALPLGDRELIRLRYDEGMTEREIAKWLRVPEGTVSGRLTRDRQQLEKELLSSLHPTWIPTTPWNWQQLRAESPGAARLLPRLFQAIQADIEGQPADAVSISRQLLATPPRDAGFKAIVCTEMASFYDHTGQPAAALQILESLLTQPGAERQYAGQYWWMQYQKGVMLRQVGEYKQAREVLAKVFTVFERETPQEDYAASALHQLGVLELKLGRYTEAENIFKTCLEKRRNDRSNHRVAYEYRRLAEVYAWTRRPAVAWANLDKAISIAKACGVARYIREIDQDIHTLRERNLL